MKLSVMFMQLSVIRDIREHKVGINYKSLENNQGHDGFRAIWSKRNITQSLWLSVEKSGGIQTQCLILGGWIKLWIWKCICRLHALYCSSQVLTSRHAVSPQEWLTDSGGFLFTRSAGNFAWDFVCSKISVIVSGRVCNGKVVVAHHLDLAR